MVETFKDGWTSTDNPHSGQPSTYKTDETVIEKCHFNCHLTEVAKKVNISKADTKLISLSQNFCMRCLAPKFMHHLLTDKQKTQFM